MSEEHEHRPQIINASLYVGNLSPQVTQPLLYEIFSALGEVTNCKIITDKVTGESQGYGFVDFRTQYSAENAMSSLNGRNLYGQDLKINWAAVATGKEDTANHHHLFVGDLSPDVTDTMLWDAFKHLESLSDARVMMDPAHGRSRGYGFVGFRDRADAEHALATMGGVWVGSRPIRVNWANQKTTQKTASHFDFESISSQVPVSNTTVYVGNLAPETMEHSIRVVFEQYGKIDEIRMQTDKGYAFVKYSNHDNATRAIIYGNGEMVGVRSVRCSWGKEKTATTTEKVTPATVTPYTYPTIATAYPAYTVYNPYLMYGTPPVYPGQATTTATATAAYPGQTSYAAYQYPPVYPASAYPGTQAYTGTYS